MKRHFTIILSLLWAIVIGFCTRTPANGQNLVDGVQLFTDQKYPQALELFKSLTKVEPDNDAAWYYRGLSELYTRNVSDAETSLKKAIALDSTNYWYRDRLAVLYSMMRNPEKAIKEYEDLLEDFPKKTDIYYSLVNLYMQTGRTDKVMETLDNIETVMGKSDPTVMARFNILLQQGKAEEAYASLKEYNEDFASPQVLSMLGDHEISAYHDSLAVMYYNEALKIDKDYSPAKLGIAEAYRVMKKYDDYFDSLNSIIEDKSISAEAKNSYLEALMQHTEPRFFQNYRSQLDSTFDLSLSVHPGDSALTETAAVYYYRTGRPEKTKELFRSNMTGNPSSIGASVTYLQVLSTLEEWDELSRESREAFGRFPDELGFLEMASSAEYNKGNYAGVISLSEEILKRAKGDSTATLYALSTLGDMYHQTGNSKQAFKAYEKALKLNPDYAPVLNNYAYYLSLEGKNLSKAYKMSKKTIEQEPDNATYIDTFAWILHLQGKDIEAKPLFKHAMLYGGKDSSTILEHYAIVLESLGENDLAASYRLQAKNKAAEEEKNGQTQ